MVKRMGVVLLCLVIWSGSSWADNYYRVLDHYHKNKQFFSIETFSADIIWDAVYLAPEMREALWKQETKITEKSARLDSPIFNASQVQGTQFIVHLYAPKGTNTFNMDDSSFWTISLVKGDEVYHPTKIEQLDMSPLAKRLFWFVNRWGSLYLVTFGTTDVTPPFTLRMVGATAKSAITWH